MEIIKRFFSETPTFHARARNIFGLLAVVIAITIGVEPSFISPKVIEVLKYLDVLFAGIATWAQTAVKDPDTLKK